MAAGEPVVRELRCEVCEHPLIVTENHPADSIAVVVSAPQCKPYESGCRCCVAMFKTMAHQFHYGEIPSA